MERKGQTGKDGSFWMGRLLLREAMKKALLATAALIGMVHGETTTVYVGSGSDGIYTLQLDEETGVLSEREHVVKGEGMSFQVMSKDKGALFSTYKSEGKGAVSSYLIEDDGLKEVSVQTYDGGGLCHVSLDAEEKVLFSADYGGGKVVSFPVDSWKIGKVASLIQHEGSSINPRRQSKAHAHSIYAGPDNKFAYAPDLGMDEVKFYAFDEKGVLTDKGGFKSIPGSGPRHMKFGKDGSHAYVLNELTLTVTTFSRDEKSGKLSAQRTLSVLADDADGEKMSCSEIRVSQDGKFIYTANRDLTKEKRDSVTVFSVAEDGSLTRISSTPAEAWIPRNINLSPSGKWLLVAGQRSNEVTSHRIDAKTGELSFSGHRARVPAAMCINFGK